MKHLYLLRHAKSSWSDSTLADKERPLNKRGKRQLAIMAPVIEQTGASRTRIHCSPAKRAEQTISGILHCLGRSNTDIQHDPTLYTFHVDTLLNWLKQRPDDEKEIMIVSHNPSLEELANRLTNTAIDAMPTCSLVHLVLPIESWKDVMRTPADLIHFLKPDTVSYDEYLRRPASSSDTHFLSTHRIQKLLLEQHNKVSALLPGSCARFDPEFLHQYRVNLRKTRSIAKTLAQLTKDKALEDFLPILKAHTSQTSHLRDLDVFIDLLANYRQRLASTSVTALCQLIDLMKCRREEESTNFVGNTNRESYSNERQQWGRFLVSRHFNKILLSIADEQAAKTCQKLKRTIIKQQRLINSASSDGEFHTLRKLIKKFRYASEIQSEQESSELKNIRRYQEIFGDFQDLAIQEVLLKPYAQNKTPEGKQTFEPLVNNLLTEITTDKLNLKRQICSMCQCEPLFGTNRDNH